jgi:hypothetical protein
MAIEKLNPMMRPRSVKMAAIIMPKSSRSFAPKLMRLLRKKTPICTESHNATREIAKTRYDCLIIWFICCNLLSCSGQFTASRKQRNIEGAPCGVRFECFSSTAPEEERLHIHPLGATEGEEIERRERLRTKWAAMEAIVGTEKRLRTVAKDLVKHFEERLEEMDGKAMVACMSRRICIDLYNEIVKLRPDWHNGNDEAEVRKIVMTGSATDGPEWQEHIRDKRRREALGKRFKAARDPITNQS